MTDEMKELLNKREDIIYHLAWNCEWGSFEYDCYKEDLEEVEREIEELKDKEEEMR